MKIILYASSFNGLTQRVFEELKMKEHSVEVCLANHEDDFRATLNDFDPNIIICPFLKQKIPDDIWKSRVCIIIHPGITGDRGPSSIEWAQYRGDTYWGVTALQADEEMDAGDIWSSRVFPMRDSEKACIYRNEVTEAAVQCVFEVVEKAQAKGFVPRKLNYEDRDIKGTWNDPMRQDKRKIDD